MLVWEEMWEGDDDEGTDTSFELEDVDCFCLVWQYTTNNSSVLKWKILLKNKIRFINGRKKNVALLWEYTVSKWDSN
jgi:hypothetical protein